MSAYATIADITALFRPLTPAETEKAEALLDVVSARLNIEAKKVNKDLTAMVATDEDLAEVAKSVTVDIVARALMTSTDQEPMTQYSQSALGYSVSGSFLVPGGGIFIKNAELRALGLLRPKYGSFEVYDVKNSRYNCRTHK